MRTAITNYELRIMNWKPLRSFGRLPVIIVLLCAASGALAQDDALRIIEAQRLELKAKGDALKKDEQRLNALRAKVDEKIAVYSKLVAQMEADIKKVEQVKGEKLEGVVKAYESMPAEDAAVRLAVLDDDTALQIMTRMKSKKAGAIIALMDPKKAAALTRNMSARSIKSTVP